LSNAQGKLVQAGTRTTRTAGAGSNEFLLFKMSDVVVNSVHVVASKGDNVPAERESS
jgi:hypothetical protein